MKLNKLSERWDKLESGELKVLQLSDDPRTGIRSKLGANTPIGSNVHVVVAGPSGSGKTAFVDTTFVLKPYLHYRKHGGPKPYFIYRSMERSPLFKEAKWRAALAYFVHNKVYDTATVLGLPNKQFDLSQEDKKILSSFDNLLADLESHCLDLKPGTSTPDKILEYAEKAAMQKGVLFESVGNKVLQNGKMIGELNEAETKNGVTIPFWTGPFGRLYTDEKKFIPNDDTVLIHVTDHVGKFKGNGKESADAHSANMSNVLRDVYGFLVVDLFQLNRDHENTYRQVKQKMKFRKKDIKNSGNPAEDADLILGIMNPSAEDIYEYEGYDVKAMEYEGTSRFRIVSCAKNSWGKDLFQLPVMFVGECGWIWELPHPEAMSERMNEAVSTLKWRP